MKTRLEINGDILIWAIERAGFEVGEFSEKFPHLSAWLAGKKKPTLKQLKTFSQKVHIPFGYLFLGEPIVEQFPIPFFRTLQAPLQRFFRMSKHCFRPGIDPPSF